MYVKEKGTADESEEADSDVILQSPAPPLPCLHGCYRSFTSEPVYLQNTAIDNIVLCIVYTVSTAQKNCLAL